MRRVIAAVIASGLVVALASCSDAGPSSSAETERVHAADLPHGFPLKAIPLPEGEVVGTLTNPDGWGVTLEVRGEVFEVADEYEAVLEREGFTVQRLSENHSRQGDLVNWVGERHDWGMTATISSKGDRPVVVDVTVASSDLTQLPSEQTLEEDAQ